MEKFLKDNWKGMALVTGVAVLYALLIRKPKGEKGEKKSAFLGSPFGKRVMFTLTNTTGSTQVVPLFNAYSNIQNSNVTISPSINEFNRTLLNEPKIVKMIEIFAQGNQAQAQKAIQKVCKDASGDQSGTNYFPLVSVMQKATDRTSIQPQNLILSGECFLNYTLDANQTVILTMHYDLAPMPEPKKKTKKRKTVTA
jgi:hypothetical protein